MVKSIDQVQSSNLPTRPAMFVGRERHLDDVVATVLNSETRIIVISGGPGVGKSALSVMAGYELIKRRNVFYVSLEGITNCGDGIVRISTVLGVNPKSDIYDEHSLHIWAKTLHRETVLILDNTDDVTLRECQERTKFISIFSSLVKQCVGDSGQSKLSVIITSRFHIVTPDPPSHEVHLEILDQHAAEEYMEHFVPHLPHSKIAELTNVTGHIPLAILILGTLTKSLSPKDVDQVILDAKSDPIDVYSPETFGEQQLDRCINVSFRYLDNNETRCFVSISLLPGTFDDATSKFIIANLTRDTKCIKKLVSRSLVEKIGSGRYGMHPFLQKYSLKHMQQQVRILRIPFKSLFIKHYMSLMSSSIQSAKANSDVKSFYLLLGIEHHNFLFLLMQLTQSSTDVPLNVLLPFVIDTFEIVRNNFPEVVVDWWDAVAKVGFASLRSQDLVWCTAELEQFVQFILSITHALDTSDKYDDYEKLETLLLNLDYLLEKAGNCSKATLVYFYQKVDTFYHLHGNDDKGFPYLKKFMETLSQSREPGEDNFVNQYETLGRIAVHLMRKGQYEEALHYLERYQNIHYDFNAAKGQVIAWIWLFKIIQGREVAHDAEIRFDRIRNTQTAYRNAENCMVISEMFYELADYETEDKWLNKVHDFLRETGTDPNLEFESVMNANHVKCYLRVSDILMSKGKTQSAIDETMKVLMFLRNEPDLPGRDEFLCKTVQSLGELYFRISKYDESKMYYEEALQQCALVDVGLLTVNFDHIRLNLIAIDIANLNFGSAAWKLGLHIGNWSSELLRKMSSWWTSEESSNASTDTTVKPIGITRTNHDLAAFTNIADYLNVMSYVKFLSSENTRHMIVATLTHLYYESDSLWPTASIIILRFLVFFCCIIASCFFYADIILKVSDFQCWLFKIHNELDKYTWSIYYAYTSPAVVLTLLAHSLYWRLHSLILVWISWLFYIIFLHPPRKLWSLCQKKHLESYPKSFSFSEYQLCVYLKFSKILGLTQSPADIAVTVSKHVKFSFIIIYIAYRYVIVVILALIWTLQFVSYIGFLLGIDSSIIYILYIIVVWYGMRNKVFYTPVI